LIIPSEAVLGILEPELSLPHGLFHSVNDIVVVDDSVRISAIGLFVAVGYQHELARPSFPEVGKTQREVIDPVGLPSSVVDADSAHLGVLGVISEVEIVEFNLTLMLVPEPGNHGVVVGTLDGVFVGPLVFH
jgi:hypothetical protein